MWRPAALSQPAAGVPPKSTIDLVIEAADPALLDAVRAALPHVRARLPQSCHLNVRLIHGTTVAPVPGAGTDGRQGPLASLPALTGRQHDILELLVTGLSNKEIGRKLNLSHFTVRNHISQVTSVNVV